MQYHVFFRHSYHSLFWYEVTLWVFVIIIWYVCVCAYVCISISPSLQDIQKCCFQHCCNFEASLVTSHEEGAITKRYRWGYMKILQVSAGLAVNLASKLANTRFRAILCNKLTCWWDIQRLTRKPWPMAIKSNQVWTKPAAVHFTSRSTAIWLPTPLLSRGASATFALGSLGTDWYCPRGLLRSSQLAGPSQGLQQNFPCGQMIQMAWTQSD